MALNLNLASGYHLPEISSALKSYVAATGKPDSLGLAPSAPSAPPPEPPPPDNAPPPGAPLINALPEAAQPIPIAPVDQSAAPTPTATPTESWAARSGRAANENFYDFKNNPIGSIGRLMSQVAAGIRGEQTTPMDQFGRQQLLQQEQAFKRADIGMQAINKAIPFIEAAKTPEAKREVARHIAETFSGPAGFDLAPMLNAFAENTVDDPAGTAKVLASFVSDPEQLAAIMKNPKTASELAKTYLNALGETKGKAKGEGPKSQIVPSGAVVRDSDGTILFDNRKGDTDKTYTLSPGQEVRDANNKLIAKGPPLPPAKPEKPDRTEFGPPTHLQIEDPNGEVRDVMAMQNRDNTSWVTADGKKTPVDVGDKFRILTGQASSNANSMNARFMNRVTESVNLGMKELDNIAHLSAGATTGTFAEAGLAGTPVGMLARQVTSQEDQFMSSAGVGLGRALAGIEAMGLMPQGSLTNNFEKLLPKAGQSRLTAMANLGHMRQTIESGIETALDTKQLTKEQTDRLQQYQKQVKEIIPWLPQDVYKLSQSKNPKATLRDFGVGQIEKGKAAAKSSVMDQADAILKGGP